MVAVSHAPSPFRSHPTHDILVRHSALLGRTLPIRKEASDETSIDGNSEGNSIPYSDGKRGATL
jgi:hypothetical protein